MKMSLISLYFTFYHFFSNAEVKVSKETVKFLATFDHQALTERERVPQGESAHLSRITYRATTHPCARIFLSPPTLFPPN
jgi:hypothetical protein